jgi:hypothetical protein
MLGDAVWALVGNLVGLVGLTTMGDHVGLNARVGFEVEMGFG